MKSIFVSSTFKDMHSERDIIQTEIVPELNSYMRKFAEEIRFVDLRWGVNTQDLDSQEGSQKVLDVCLNEIDYCKPYMIILLGERYGWVPDKDLLINSVKDKEFELDTDIKSVTALEIEYGALSKNSVPENCFFYFREALPYDEMSEEDRTVYESENPEYYTKLNALKQNIKERFGERVFFYSGKWNAETRKLTQLDEFKDRMLSDIKGLIDKEYANLETLTWQEREQKDIQLYIDGKCRQFSAREELIDTYALAVTNPSNKLVVVKGEAGSGKSSVLCKLAERFCNDANVFTFISANSLKSSTIEDFLLQVIYYLEKLLGKSEYYVYNKNDSAEDLSYLFGMLTNEYEKMYSKKLIIFVDALDQLLQNTMLDNYAWLPSHLSPLVTVVVSHLSQCDFNIPYTYKYTSETLEIPNLNDDEKRHIIAGILKSAGKEVDKKTINVIIEKENSCNPFYLQLLIQRLLMFDSNDFNKIASLGNDMGAISSYMSTIVRECSNNLEELSAQVLLFGSEKIAKEQCDLILQLIASTRFGLRQNDIEQIFSRLNLNWSSLDLSRFLNYLSIFFSQREDGRINFTHKSLRLGIMKLTDQDRINKILFEQYNSLQFDDSIKAQELMYYAFLSKVTDGVIDTLAKYGEILQNDDIYDIASTVTNEMLYISKLDNIGWLLNVLQSESDDQTLAYACNIIFTTMWDYSTKQHFEISQKVYDLLAPFIQRISLNSDKYNFTLLSCYYTYTYMFAAINDKDNQIAFQIKLIELYEKSELTITTAIAELDTLISMMSTTDERYKTYCVKMMDYAQKKYEEDDSFENANTYIPTLWRMGEYFQFSHDNEKALEHFNKASEILYELHESKGAKIDYYLLAQNSAYLYKFYSSIDSNNLALEECEKLKHYSEKAYEENNDIHSMYSLALAYRDYYYISNKISLQGDYTNLTKAVEMFEVYVDNSNSFKAYDQLFNFYDSVLSIFISKSNPAYLEYYDKIIALYEKISVMPNVNISVYEDVITDIKAKVDISNQNYESALVHYTKAEKAYEYRVKTDKNESSLSSLGLLYISISSTYEKLHNPKKQTVYVKQAIDTFEELCSINCNSNYLQRLGDLYNIYGGLTGNIQFREKSIEFYEKSLADNDLISSRLLLITQHSIVATALEAVEPQAEKTHFHFEKALSLAKDIYDKYDRKNCPLICINTYISTLRNYASYSFKQMELGKAKEKYELALSLYNNKPIYILQRVDQLHMLKDYFMIYIIDKLSDVSTDIILMKLEHLKQQLEHIYTFENDVMSLHHLYAICKENYSTAYEYEKSELYCIKAINVLKDEYEKTNDITFADEAFSYISTNITVVNDISYALDTIGFAQSLIPIIKDYNNNDETMMQIMISHSYVFSYASNEMYEKAISHAEQLSDKFFIDTNNYLFYTLADIFNNLCYSYIMLGENEKAFTLVSKYIAHLTGNANFSLKSNDEINCSLIEEKNHTNLINLLDSIIKGLEKTGDIEEYYGLYDYFFDTISPISTVNKLSLFLQKQYVLLDSIAEKDPQKDLFDEYFTLICNLNELLENPKTITQTDTYIKLCATIYTCIMHVVEKYNISDENKAQLLEIGEFYLAQYGSVQQEHKEDDDAVNYIKISKIFNCIKKFEFDAIRDSMVYYIPPTTEYLLKYSFPEFDSDDIQGSTDRFMLFHEAITELCEAGKFDAYIYSAIEFHMASILLAHGSLKSAGVLFEMMTTHLVNKIDETLDVEYVIATLSLTFFRAIEYIKIKEIVNIKPLTSSMLDFIAVCEEDFDDSRILRIKADIYYLESLCNYYEDSYEAQIQSLWNSAELLQQRALACMSMCSLETYINLLCEILTVHLDNSNIDEVVDVQNIIVSQLEDFVALYTEKLDDFEGWAVYFQDSTYEFIVNSLDKNPELIGAKFEMIQYLFDFRAKWVETYALDIIKAFMLWAECSANFGSIDTAVQTYDMAIGHLINMIAEYDDIDDYCRLSVCYNELHRLYLDMGNTNKANEYMEKSKQIQRQIEIKEEKLSISAN